VAATDLLGETLNRKYKLLSLLGEGGMGAVYEAEHKSTALRVAVKVINADLLAADPAGAQRFRREARAASAVDSEHIVQVLDSGVDEATGLLFMVMERLRGHDLEQLLDRVGPLAPDVALRIAAQALIGLHKAHEAKIVHRDIKPANLFLARGRDGAITIKLLDFGIAKFKAEPLGTMHTTNLTRTNGFLGTPLFMSPEQIQSSRDVDRRTDVWSLGVTLYCALAGRAPCDARAPLGHIVYSIASAPPEPLRTFAPWVSPEVEKAVHGALGIRPDDRYPTAAAMLEALMALLPDGVAIREEMLVAFPEAREGTAEGEPAEPYVATLFVGAAAADLARK
jgi:serine/threonine-protein kinase